MSKKNEDVETRRLNESEIEELCRYDVPTIFNGWEQITAKDPGRECFNLEPAVDYMAEFGTRAGRAMTVVIQPGNPAHARNRPNAWAEYRRYIGGTAGSKIVVVQDLDKPIAYGSVWGEVNAGVHRTLGCTGVIVDGAIRDVPQMAEAGIKALARQVCIGHGHGTPVSWGDPVEAFGCRVHPGQLVVADQHGFLAVPPEDEGGLLEAVRFMEDNERATKIAAIRDGAGKSAEEFLDAVDEANRRFKEAALARFARAGEG